MTVIPIFILIVIIVAAIVTSVVASMYAYLYLKKSNDMGKLKTFDEDTVGFVKGELKKTISEAIAEIEPKVFMDKKLNDLIHEKISETLDDVKLETLTSVKKETQSFQDEYKNALSDLRATYQQRAEESIKKVENILKNEFSDFKNILKNETIESQHIIQRKIEQVYDQAVFEIEDFKKQRIETINKELTARAQQILGEVLHDSLNDSDHEKLIKESVEKALKSGFFKKV